MTTVPTTTTTSKHADRGQPDAACRTEIHIHNPGDVNIYSCSAPAPGPAPCPPATGEECPGGPIAPGQCLPLTMGAKPKQSQHHKLDRLVQDTQVPSALAASFFHQSRRFLAGHSPANAFEESTFAVFDTMPTELRNLMACAGSSFDVLAPPKRDRLFDPAIPIDPSLPLDLHTFGAAYGRELTQRTGLEVYGDPDGIEQERPGQNRFFDPGGAEIFDPEIVVCTLNGLRTNEFRPLLSPGDYLPSELQIRCVPVEENGEVHLDCDVQIGNCPGNPLPDGTCLRVPKVEAGSAVQLQGMNFASVDITVRLAAVPPGTVTREVEAHVVGDIDTPLTEVVNGVTVLIRDCRVHDRLTFRLPDDLPPGVYSVQLAVPNVSGFPSLPDRVLTNPQFVEVVPPNTARFQIASERLIAHQETSPASFGSDEVRVRVRAYSVLGGPDGLVLGAEHAFDSPKFNNVDSGDEFDLSAVLFGHQEPIEGVVLSILGFEIDSETAYQEQIDDFTDAFLHYVKVVHLAFWGTAASSIRVASLKDLLKLALKYWFVLVIAEALILAIAAFLATWAPADPIIADTIGLTTLDLAALTSAELPPPPETTYPSIHDIDVKVVPLEKAPTQYRERRQYHSAEEDSRYELILRYNRLA